ncbi:hypothetical protein GQ602_006373 [Ophiocordyceps camponoti-floridani]|uniref:Uncharacterized protein n=1 Tax=Ophiocordyceps camponoti-floridani TaxID=2030778 RepID=A0A8H4Q350_9HYPO|nr:hypothetical protein GQ602_006373 [Ophiocordyceps camponoti-floridani]
MGSVSHTSPGAAILRKSRMFSLPKPLRDPDKNTAYRLRDYRSSTSTKSHPTHQAIASLPIYRELGDWGLKRPLPRKTTLSTSTPVIRINAIDSRESITDFASSANYWASLEKFRELNVSFSVKDTLGNYVERDAYQQQPVLLRKSVFEDDIDFTYIPVGRHEFSTIDRRWKFSGPWVSRMSEGQFARYLKKKVWPRRAEFRSLLKDLLAQELTANQNKVAREKGDDLPPSVTPQDITDEQFMEFLRKIRDDRILSYGFTSRFLDMGPLGHPSTSFARLLMPTRGTLTRSPYSKHGPPCTHPSAGMSYLRTHAYMENHPIYGPQNMRTPVEVRIVSPKTGSRKLRVGVAGFVSEPPRGNNDWNQRVPKQPSRGTDYLDIVTYGGGKSYVHVEAAFVDSLGRILPLLGAADEESKLIAKEMKGEKRIFEKVI